MATYAATLAVNAERDPVLVPARPCLHEARNRILNDQDGRYVSASRAEKKRLMASALRLVACFTLCFAVALAGALVTRPEIPGWYALLSKPAWTPPNWVFPAAWNILYALMAISLWRLWERSREGAAGAGRAISLFLLQLAFNAAWSPIFFGLHAIRWGLAIIVVLAMVVAATIAAAYRVDRSAALLLVPYLGWILYASSLNAGIAIFNR